ncbi:hypothetical protein NQ318_014635 [Aromia moschata]|uniref:DNA-directed DNA polymerase n=1 Tax=Aromia moschata TaxID=1265417 RepID=A0AAV8ZBC0_9CUCU|nr:hypothetical protein NQ318_014635 [Aromia moschata]
MSGYDFHMFIKELFSDKKNANVIAQSKEKYIFFAKYLHVDTYIDKKAYTQHNTHREEAYDSLATVNVVIAAYVTTQVHLKLYSYLELLGGRVLYYDTDSVIYIARDKSRVRCSNGRVPRRNYRRVRIIRAR